MPLNIVQDGLTYCIDLSEALGPNKIEGLLREDTDGWLLNGVGYSWSYRIGKRKLWANALRDALIHMDFLLQNLIEQER